MKAGDLFKSRCGCRWRATSTWGELRIPFVGGSLLEATPLCNSHYEARHIAYVGEGYADGVFEQDTVEPFDYLANSLQARFG